MVIVIIRFFFFLFSFFFLRIQKFHTRIKTELTPLADFTTCKSDNNKIPTSTPIID